MSTTHLPCSGSRAGHVQSPVHRSSPIKANGAAAGGLGTGKITIVLPLTMSKKNAQAHFASEQ